MSAAADAVSLSQPALTQGLAKLERQLGTPLFERRSDGVRPTPAGLMVSDRVQAAFAHLGQAARGMSRGTRGFSRPEQMMTATQLHAYLSLADAGSFVGAAQATGLSQPALHRAVRDLEQIFAAILVERRGRGVALTTAGQRFARGVRLAAKEIAAAQAEVHPAAGGGGNRIAVGAMPLCRARLLPRAIAALTAIAPQVTMDIVEGAWRELVGPLRDGVIDVLIGALRADAPPDLHQRSLFVDQLVVVGGAHHPLAALPAPTLSDLAAFGWVIGREGTPMRRHWAAMFGDRPPPRAPIECGSVMTIRGILRDTDFLTLLSPAQIALEVEAGMLTTIGEPLSGSTRDIGITTRTDWRPTAAQRLFLQMVEEAAQTDASGFPMP